MHVYVNNLQMISKWWNYFPLIHLQLHVCMYDVSGRIYIYIYIYVCVCVCVCVCVWTIPKLWNRGLRSPSAIWIYVYMYMSVYVCVCVCMSICLCLCACAMRYMKIVSTVTIINCGERYSHIDAHIQHTVSHTHVQTYKKKLYGQSGFFFRSVVTEHSTQTRTNTTNSVTHTHVHTYIHIDKIVVWPAKAFSKVVTTLT
jgi:hypothetical protein